MRVYNYGAKPPRDPAAKAEVERQMIAGHRHRNNLAATEIERRKRVHALTCDLCPELAHIDEQLTRLETALDAAATKADRAPLIAALRDLRATAKPLRLALYDRSDFRERQAEITDWYWAEGKRLRAACGCYWGTYLLAEAAMAGSNSGPPPSFRRWTGAGTLGLQFQASKPLTFGGALACQDTRLQIALTEQRFGRAAKRRAIVRWRIGSEGRQPKWIEFGATIHRQPAPEAVIKEARLIRECVADIYHWRLVLTVDESPAPIETSEQAEMVAVHPGWRTMPDCGLQVALWRGTDGREGKVILPYRMLETFDHQDRTAGLIDDAFNEIRPWLADLLRDHPEYFPEYFYEQARAIAHWRSPMKLITMARWYEEELYQTAPIAVIERLLLWRRDTLRLLRNDRHARIKFAKRRLDMYRCIARQLQRGYRHVAIAPIAKAELTRKKQDKRDDEQKPLDTTRVRRNAAIAASSTLIQCVAQAFGVNVVKVSSVDITGKCAVCGGKMLLHGEGDYCTKCHRRVDRDANAAENQLARGLVARQQAVPLADEAAEEVAGENGKANGHAGGEKTPPARKRRRNRRRDKIVQ